MSYRMTEITENVRVGLMRDGSMDIEVWDVPFGWRGVTPPIDNQMTQVVISPEAVIALAEFLTPL